MLHALCRGAVICALTLGLIGDRSVSRASNFNFEWIGKIEMDAEGLEAGDVKTRREAVSALGKYDIALTAPHLLEALNDTDWRVRAEAGRILARHKVLKAAPIIIEWLNEPEASIKQEAADILADLATDDAVSALVRSLGDPEARVRQRAATALGKIGTPPVVVPLIGRLEDDKSEVRKAAIAQLEQIGDRSAVIPLVGSFNDSNLDVRKAAINAVGHLGDPSPIPALLRLLRDPVEDIKIAAVASLGNLEAEAATDILIEELAKGGDAYRIKVAYALGQIARKAGDSQATRDSADRAVRALVQALAESRLRSAASEALRNAGPVAVPALVAHLQGKLEGDLTAAIQLIRDIGDPRATPALVAELDRGRVSHDLLLEALQKSGDDRALVPILGLLSSVDPKVRRKAMSALRPIIDDLRAADILVTLLDDSDVEIRIQAAEYLGLMRSKQSVPKLIRLIQAGNKPRMRRSAVDALGEIGDARATTGLIKILSDGPETLHHAAASALIYIADRTSTEPLIRLARDPEASARHQAVRALGGILRDESDEDARKALQSLAVNEALLLSLSSIEALGAMDDAGARDTLTKLSGSDSHRRRAAATALGNLGDRSAVPTLLKALDASDDRVAGDAAWALAKLADPKAIDGLLRATRRRGWATAINASAALARYAPRSHATRIIDLLYHKNRFVRANAAAALGRLGATAARSKLALLLRKEASPLARSAMCRALGRIGGAKTALTEASKIDRDKGVRDACKAALNGFKPPKRTEWRHFYFVDPDNDSAPVKQEPYFLATSDGLITAYYTDARGIVTEERVPKGDYIIAPRSKSSRY